jgi:hypothetical protein
VKIPDLALFHLTPRDLRVSAEFVEYNVFAKEFAALGIGKTYPSVTFSGI